MLPPNLDDLRTKLRSSANRSPQQDDTLKELDAVSQAIDDAGRLSRSIPDELSKKFSRKAYGTWGGNPGACQCCGK